MYDRRNMLENVQNFEGYKDKTYLCLKPYLV